MIPDDARYFAGILDGEGWVECTKRLKKCSNNKIYKCSSIHIEVQMTHKGVMEWLKEKAEVGTLRMRKAASHQNLDTWRWRCCYRDAYKLAKDVVPYSIVKKETLQRIVDHYAN